MKGQLDAIVPRKKRATREIKVILMVMSKKNIIVIAKKKARTLYSLPASRKNSIFFAVMGFCAAMATMILTTKPIFKVNLAESRNTS